MKPKLREILAESHIAAVSIASLLFWSLQALYGALSDPILHVVSYVFMAVAILGVPYSSPGLNIADRLCMEASAASLSYALIDLAAAWLLARWAYGMGPFRTLNSYWSTWKRRSHA